MRGHHKRLKFTLKISVSVSFDWIFDFWRVPPSVLVVECSLRWDQMWQETTWKLEYIVKKEKEGDIDWWCIWGLQSVISILRWPLPGKTFCGVRRFSSMSVAICPLDTKLQRKRWRYLPPRHNTPIPSFCRRGKTWVSWENTPGEGVECSAS